MSGGKIKLEELILFSKASEWLFRISYLKNPTFKLFCLFAILACVKQVNSLYIDKKDKEFHLSKLDEFSGYLENCLVHQSIFKKEDQSFRISFNMFVSSVALISFAVEDKDKSNKMFYYLSSLISAIFLYNLYPSLESNLVTRENVNKFKEFVDLYRGNLQITYLPAEINELYPILRKHSYLDPDLQESFKAALKSVNVNYILPTPNFLETLALTLFPTQIAMPMLVERGKVNEK